MKCVLMCSLKVYNFGELRTSIGNSCITGLILYRMVLNHVYDWVSSNVNWFCTLCDWVGFVSWFCTLCDRLVLYTMWLGWLHGLVLYTMWPSCFCTLSWQAGFMRWFLKNNVTGLILWVGFVHYVTNRFYGLVLYIMWLVGNYGSLSYRLCDRLVFFWTKRMYFSAYIEGNRVERQENGKDKNFNRIPTEWTWTLYCAV